MQAFGLHQFLEIYENVAGGPNRPPPLVEIGLKMALNN